MREECVDNWLKILIIKINLSQCLAADLIHMRFVSFLDRSYLFTNHRWSCKYVRIKNITTSNLFLAVFSGIKPTNFLSQVMAFKRFVFCFHKYANVLVVISELEHEQSKRRQRKEWCQCRVTRGARTSTSFFYKLFVNLRDGRSWEARPARSLTQQNFILTSG